MASISSTISISLPNLLSFPSISKSRSHFSQNTRFSYPLALSTKPILFHTPFDTNCHHQKRKKSSKLWITFATPEEVVASGSTALDNSDQIVSTTGDEGVATIIQGLLFVAFVALTILTIGVIYIAVQDFLDKRGREKFEKEEAAKNEKKSKKKKNVRAKTGPRGFGQKIDEEDDDI